MARSVNLDVPESGVRPAPVPKRVALSKAEARANAAKVYRVLARPEFKDVGVFRDRLREETGLAMSAVLEAVIWMRAHGVVIESKIQPLHARSDLMTRFFLVSPLPESWEPRETKEPVDATTG